MSPYALLGLSDEATAHEIRAARRELARTLHPDAGGDHQAMQRVNAAAAEALAQLRHRTSSAPHPSPTPETPSAPSDWFGLSRDAPSFTVEALPVEAFEALLVAAAELGEIEDDDPPYELRLLLAPPLRCWCQLDIVPDAGASTVSVSIVAAEGDARPSLLAVRNAWIDTLNALDWSALGTDQ